MIVTQAYAESHFTGGHAMFLGSQDIQLGVNESLFDTAKVVSSMVDGIMARVGHHSEVEVSFASENAMPSAENVSQLGLITKLDCASHQRSFASISPYTNSRRSAYHDGDVRNRFVVCRGAFIISITGPDCRVGRRQQQHLERYDCIFRTLGHQPKDSNAEGIPAGRGCDSNSSGWSLE